ncbi:Herpeto [Micropterus dolomieu adomavirus 1]
MDYVKDHVCVFGLQYLHLNSCLNCAFGFEYFYPNTCATVSFALNTGISPNIVLLVSSTLLQNACSNVLLDMSTFTQNVHVLVSHE